jgi:hypothetical protein
MISLTSVPLCTIPKIFIRGMIGMPVTMSPTTRLVLSWDMFEDVATFEPENGQSMDANIKCRFDVAWNGSDVTVTVRPHSLRVSIGASETAELLKHVHDHSDITFLTASRLAGRPQQ